MEGDRLRDVGFDFREVCYRRWCSMGQEEYECREGEVVRVRMRMMDLLVLSRGREA